MGIHEEEHFFEFYEMRDYIAYVNDKISMNEMPCVFERWQRAGLTYEHWKLKWKSGIDVLGEQPRQKEVR